MNKTMLLVAALLAVSVPASAAERYQAGEAVGQGGSETQGIHEPGTGLAAPELKAENQGSGYGLWNGAEATTADEAVANRVAEREMNMASGERRGKVSNAVREMVQAADRNGGIGERVREIARLHEEDNNKIEDGLDAIKNRGQFRKFLFGPDYKKISDTEEMLARHTARLAELRSLTSQAISEDDKTLLEQRISEMEAIKAEIEKEVLDEQKGFSLFGWLNKLINKK